ncbi:MAG: hypothetical protein GX595_03465, partial [Lentisphaerae bacterium]|nr:hypothetical protein [Lentisphaerota bacterium]
TCDDEAVPAGAATRLSAGAHRIVVETVSALVHAPFEALAAFPLGDATVELPEGASEREAAAAQMIQDFIEVRLGKTLPRGPAAGGPAIQLGRSAEGQRRGVTLTGGTLDIRGTDAFDTQQVVWDLLRFLDRYDSRFTPIHAALYGSGDAATTEMLKKAGLLKQWVRAVQRDTRLAWNGFAKPERTAGPGTVNPEELPSIDIPTLEGPTVIDGRLDDDAWSQAAVFDSISMLRTGAAPTQATEVRMFRTSDALVVGFICHESAMHRVLAQMTARDSQVWNDDVFELRLAPGVDGTQATYPYYVFLINSIGTKADLEKGGAELAWNADWDGAVQRDAASWSGELRIPLAALNGAGAATWRGNVSRYEKPNAEYSTWSPIPESTADQPARFGILRMR